MSQNNRAALYSANPLVWNMHDSNTSQLLRGEVLANGHVMLSPRAFFDMLEICYPKKFDAELFDAINGGLREKFEFVRLTSIKTMLRPRGGDLVKDRELVIKHTARGINYIVPLLAQDRKKKKRKK